MLSLFLASASSAGSLSIDSPLVLGPIAAFVFTVFVSEVIVPGKAYKREVEENNRLRALTEKVVPLAEQMVTATKEIVAATAAVTEVMEDAIEILAGDEARQRTRRRRPN